MGFCSWSASSNEIPRSLDSLDYAMCLYCFLCSSSEWEAFSSFHSESRIASRGSSLFLSIYSLYGGGFKKVFSALIQEENHRAKSGETLSTNFTSIICGWCSFLLQGKTILCLVLWDCIDSFCKCQGRWLILTNTLSSSTRISHHSLLESLDDLWE